MKVDPGSGSNNNYQAPAILKPNQPGGPVGYQPPKPNLPSASGYGGSSPSSTAYQPGGNMGAMQFNSQATQNFNTIPLNHPAGSPAGQQTAPQGYQPQQYQPQFQSPQTAPQQSQQTPQSQPAGGYGGPMNVQTSINPIEVYSQQQTDDQWKREVAKRAILANSQAGMKGMGGPGRSLGYGQRAQWSPQAAEYAAQMGTAPAMTQFADATANMQSLRSGQEARDGEANQLAGTASYLDNANKQNNLYNQQAMINMLLGYI